MPVTHLLMVEITSSQFFTISCPLSLIPNIICLTSMYSTLCIDASSVDLGRRPIRFYQVQSSPTTSTNICLLRHFLSAILLILSLSDVLYIHTCCCRCRSDSLIFQNSKAYTNLYFDICGVTLQSMLFRFHSRACVRLRLPLQSCVLLLQSPYASHQNSKFIPLRHTFTILGAVHIQTLKRLKIQSAFKPLQNLCVSQNGHVFIYGTIHCKGW